MSELNVVNIREHMEVRGSDGKHVGTVDSIEGGMLKLTKNDPQAGGQHHYIPVDWVDHTDKHVHLRVTCDAAMERWQTQP